MSIDKWVSKRVLIGASLIALLIVLWGIYQWRVQHWFIYIVSIPLVFVSAISQKQRVYLLVLFLYVLANFISESLFRRGLFMNVPEAIQWISFAIAGEVIYQISNQRRRTEEFTRRRIHELEVMTETLTEISSDLELDTLLQTINERAVKLLNASLGELYLYNKQSGEMDIVARYPPDKNLVGFKIKMGEGAMGHVAVTKRPLILNDYKAFVNTLPESIKTDVEATLDVPLLKGDELIGVLGVVRREKKHKFTLDDQSLLTVFASQATVAIENARLYMEVQHLAYTDGLIGIPNRRRLFELADKEYKRSMRYHRPLSFMLVDIDHFKDINDTHGHPAGDETLRWFATECNTTIRQNVDIIGRYGGEEFAMIYPEIELPSALIAGERLRRHVAEKCLVFDDVCLQITFSSGIVSLPFEEQITLDQLIERADKALYLAKQKRNSIAFWDDANGCPVMFSGS